MALRTLQQSLIQGGIIHGCHRLLMNYKWQNNTFAAEKWGSHYLTG